ncbi:MAG: TIM barrel protein [Alphaproteobacteria bacterium]|nr:TIM barrel protein [Alphaproteobacteria bacterium]
MTIFSADLDTLFQEYPFYERFKQAKENGFNFVEFTYNESLDLQKLGDACAYKGLKISLVTISENLTHLAFENKKKFMKEFDAFVEIADFIECKNIYIPGISLKDDEFEEKCEVYIQSLKYAGSIAKKYGIKILISFKNGLENLGYYPSSTLDVLSLLDELDDDRQFAYLYDIYQAQTIEGGISNTLETFLKIIGHIRIAGVPLREEPDSGELDYRYILSLLESHSYQAKVGCSYFPRGKTIDGLKWMKRYV